MTYTIRVKSKNYNHVWEYNTFEDAKTACIRQIAYCMRFKRGIRGLQAADPQVARWDEQDYQEVYVSPGYTFSITKE